MRTTLYMGRPVRVRTNEYARDWEDNRKEEMLELESRGIVVYRHEVKKARVAKKHFDIARTFPQFIGQAAGGIEVVKPAAAILQEMVDDAVTAIRASATCVAGASKL